PDIIPLDCPLVDAEQVARQLDGSAGCSGVDAEHLKNQLLKHGKASAELCKELVEWATMGLIPCHAPRMPGCPG
ncbi:hypothetical protein ACHAW6_003583, partial [Cyclotella cf. meneghiniana]